MLKDRLNKHFDNMDFIDATCGPANPGNCHEFVIVSDDGKYHRLAILEAVVKTEAFDDCRVSYRAHNIDEPDMSFTYNYANLIAISSLPLVVSKRLGNCYLLGLANENIAVVTPISTSDGRGVHYNVPRADIAWPDNIKWGLDYQEPCDAATDELPNRCREEGA